MEYKFCVNCKHFQDREQGRFGDRNTYCLHPENASTPNLIYGYVTHLNADDARILGTKCNLTGVLFEPKEPKPPFKWHFFKKGI